MADESSDPQTTQVQSHWRLDQGTLPRRQIPEVARSWPRFNGSWSLPAKQVIRRVLRADPTQEYYVYIPDSAGNEAPLCVSIHGARRNAQEHVKLLANYCDRVGAVLLSPVLSADRYPGYQRLGTRGHLERADTALESIVEEVAWLTGASAAQFYLFGYSGGAQFAHRYAMACPHRVAKAVIASAGWYTFPDSSLRYPYGIRPSLDLPNLLFDPEEFLRVPMTVIVGALDRSHANLRRSKRVNQQQGRDRVERARNWVAAMRAAAESYNLEPNVSLEVVPGVKHAFKTFVEKGQLGDRVFEALFGLHFFPSD